MGGSAVYSSTVRTSRAKSMGYFTKSSSEIFQQKQINSAMNPYGVQLRESRDSDNLPASLAVVIALDVTGSMGSIPNHLVKDGLPTMMSKIMSGGVDNPQVLFLGIGDHECDQSPLQVGQFESSDDLLDKWLTSVYLESGGGGNDGESYLLAWYFAGHRTSIDCFEKRGEKGFLFTIGDEPTLQSIPKSTIKELMGDGQYDNFSAIDLLSKAQEKYNVYHIHVKETSSGSRSYVMDGWKQLLSDNLIIVNRHQEIPDMIAEIITSKRNQSNQNDQNNQNTEPPKNIDEPQRPQVMML